MTDTFADYLMMRADEFGNLTYDVAIKALRFHGLSEADLMTDRPSLWELMLGDELASEDLLTWLGY